MKVLTEKELVEIFLNKSKKSNETISIKSRTNLKLKKKARSDSKSLLEKFNTNSIYKITENVVQINTIYDNSVNNRREKEDLERDFESEKLPYGEYVGDSRIVFQYNEKYYLRTYQTNSRLGKESKYYRENGTQLSDVEVKILKEDFMSELPETIESQGLSYEKSCKPTNYLASGILELCMNDEEYEVKHEE